MIETRCLKNVVIFTQTILQLSVTIFVKVEKLILDWLQKFEMDIT